MSRARFAVTFEIVTQESAEIGETDKRGYIEESATLRDAIKEFHRTRTSAVEGVQSIECDSSPCVRPRCITVNNGMEFVTGAYESRSLHIPDTVSNASARRVARLAGAKLK